MQNRGSERSGNDLRELVILFVAITLVVSIGTLGYIAIEGWAPLDALYMTVITLATVGFGEIHPLSDAGRWFTIFLIFTGVGVAMVLLTTMANKILERELRWIWRQGKMKEAIANVRDHTIFCGFGRLAQVAAKELHDSSIDIVVIDQNEAQLEEAQKLGLLTLQGDGTSDEILEAAGIHRAKRLVSLLPKDADNLYVILAAKEINPAIFTLTRAEQEAGEKRLKQAGADRIIAPYRVGGQKIADGLLRPHVLDFLELAGSATTEDLFIEEIFVPEQSMIAGKTIGASNLRKRARMILVALVQPTGKTVFNPKDETVIDPGSTLIGMGERKDFDNIESLLMGTHQSS